MASTNKSLRNGLDRDAHASTIIGAENVVAGSGRRRPKSGRATVRSRRRAALADPVGSAADPNMREPVQLAPERGTSVRVIVDADGGRLGITVEPLNAVTRFESANTGATVVYPAASVPRTRLRSNSTGAVDDEAPWTPIETLADVLDDETDGEEWLWPGRIPAGAITGLEGMPGEGKSSITMDLAARVTTGEPMPFFEGRRSPAGVVVFNSEDAKQIIRRRAVVAGADLGRMAILGAESVGIFGDLGRLEAAINKVAARLVIVDPVMAAFGRGTNSKDDQSVRRELSPLAELAARTGAAIVVVRHPTKSASGDLRYQGSGTIGITAALRSILTVRERINHPGERLLVHVKCNCGPLARSIAYRIVPAGRAGRVDWLDEADSDVE